MVITVPIALFHQNKVEFLVGVSSYWMVFATLFANLIISCSFLLQTCSFRAATFVISFATANHIKERKW